MTATTDVDFFVTIHVAGTLPETSLYDADKTVRNLTGYATDAFADSLSGKLTDVKTIITLEANRRSGKESTREQNEVKFPQKIDMMP